MSVQQQPQGTRRGSGVTGLALVAGLFIGIGVGMLAGNVGAGAMLGLGAGFLGMVVLRVLVGEW